MGTNQYFKASSKPWFKYKIDGFKYAVLPKTFAENWDIELGVGLDEGGDPPRVWSPTGKYPGNAFTRSIGDKLSESLGVYDVYPQATINFLLGATFKFL